MFKNIEIFLPNISREIEKKKKVLSRDDQNCDRRSVPR